jgi:hypothetical protein
MAPQTLWRLGTLKLRRGSQLPPPNSIFLDVLADSAVTGDTSTAALIAAASLSDSSVTGDTNAAALIASANLADTGASGDTFSGTAVYAGSLSDAGTTGDSASARLIAGAILADTSLTGDALAAALLTADVLNDSAVTGDTRSAQIIATASLSDSAVTGDAFEAPTGAVYNETLFDSALPGDVFNAEFITDQISGGGRHKSIFSRQRKQEDEQPEADVSLETHTIVKIGTAPHEVITGLVIPKTRQARLSPSKLEALDRAKFESSKTKSDRLRAIQLADDEWLLLN